MKKERGIYKRGDIWYIRFAGPDGRIIKESTHSTEYREAVALRIKRRAEVQEGRYSIRPRVECRTFNALAREYLKFVEGTKSYRNKKYILKMLCERLGPVPLRNISTMAVEQYIAEQLKAGKSPATINRKRALLSHMFRKAEEWEYCDRTALDRIRRVKLLPENNRRLRFLSAEECQALIHACDDHLRPMVIAALSTGMRKGEILNLKWENVDLRHNLILLSQQQTKNAERKELPISETLRATLAAIPRRLDIPFVFYNPDTGNRFEINLKRSFHSACKRAGIEDFRFHDLRHTFASHLVMSGVDLITVKDLLGHKDLTMTARYSHLSPAHTAGAIKAIDSVLFQKPAQEHLCP